MEVYQRGDYFAVVGTLHDERPWARGTHGPRHLHVMELGLVVRRADMTIVDAAADMQTFPHAECTDIEASFHDLIGLSVARGYTERGPGALRTRAGLQPPGIPGPGPRARRGAGRHLVGGLAGRERRTASIRSREGGFAFLANTCHVWAEDGPGTAEDRGRLAARVSSSTPRRRPSRCGAGWGRRTAAPAADGVDVGLGAATGGAGSRATALGAERVERGEHAGHHPSGRPHRDARRRAQVLPGLPR